MVVLLALCKSRILLWAIAIDPAPTIAVKASTPRTIFFIKTSHLFIKKTKELEFKYPVIEFVEVEKAIAKELNLPLDKIRKLIRYRLD
jgi:hypothetical protein